MVNIGQRFGKWTVIGKAESRNGNGYSTCQCDCGIIREVANGNLRNGHSNSCSCSVSKNPHRVRLSRGMEPLNRRLQFIRNHYLNSARVRDIVYDLPDNLLEELSNLPCHYCGAPPSNNSHKENFQVTYQGLDRKDPDLGYLPGNVVPCCHPCNIRKGSIPYQQYRDSLED